MRKIIHIDMDCFYAAIEMRDNPALKGKPIAVGGSADKRGVLCTCNYEARKFGVHSAMSTAYALRACPDLILLPVNMAKYKAVAYQIRDIFYQYTDKIEPLSLDEAYLDVSDSPHYQGSATLIAKAIREKIFKAHNLTASAGVAPNKFLAKVASDWNKPNGQFVIKPGTITPFVAALPITKIPGVGAVTAKKLHSMGLQTCHDLQSLPLEQLLEKFGAFGKKLFDYSRGIDQREVDTNRIRKSVSVEETFSKDIPQLKDCLAEIPALSEQLNHRLKPYADSLIKTTFLKLKFTDFSVTTAECTVTKNKLETFQQLCKIAYQRRELPIRLLGLGVRFHEDYDNKIEQLALL